MEKRILIYTNHFYPEEFKINEIVKWLSEKDVHVRVLTGLPNYPDGKILKGYSKKFNKKIVINRLYLIPRGNGTAPLLIINFITYFISCLFFTIYIAIAKKKYDVIFVHHTSPIFIAIHPIVYSLFKKTKKILWDLDIWPESLKAVDVIKSKFYLFVIESVVKWIYSYYHSILVGSKSVINVVKKRFDGEVIYFPNWADNVIEKNKIDTNFMFETNPRKFNIIYTGNIGTAQNFESLTKTIELLDENIHWTFVGDGRFKIDCIPQIASKANALFLSLRDDEIFTKTVPAKLQTYMALGKPIIGVLSGDGAELIKEANCGITEENYDYESLAKKINSFATMDLNYLNQLGNNAKQYYNESFASSIRKKQILNLIYEC